MATISIDVESNKTDLDTLVESANGKISELQAILSQISSFQLAFTVAEVPTSDSDQPAEPNPTPELPAADQETTA